MVVNDHTDDPRSDSMKIQMAEHFDELEYEYREDPHTDAEVVHEDDQVIVVADHTGHELAEWASDFNMTHEDRDAFWKWNYDVARDLTDHDWVAVDPVVFDKPETTMTDKSADNDSTETNDDVPTVNGVELDSGVGVAHACRYLDDSYNVGNIDVRSSEDLVTIQSPESHFGHMEALLAAQKQGHISIQLIAAGTNRDGDQCLNIELVGDSTETNDSTPTVSGVELDSVAAVANAFAYSDDPCNVNNIAVRESEDLLIIQSRGACFGHMGALMQAQKQGHISIQLITAGTNHNGDPCLTIGLSQATDNVRQTLVDFCVEKLT